MRYKLNVTALTKKPFSKVFEGVGNFFQKVSDKKITRRLRNELQKIIHQQSFNLTDIQISIDIKSVDDNVVGLLSQIGCTKNNGDCPNKKIDFEKMFVNIDTDGGNNLFTSRFHSKMPHREVVIDKVGEFLSE